MWQKIKIYRTLAFRLFAGLFLVLVILFTINVISTINNQEKQIMHLVETSAFSLSDIIKKSTWHGMLLNRREDVHQIIKTIGTEPGVEGIRIYNKKGEIIFSTKDEERFTFADLSSSSCSPCHEGLTPRADLLPQERMRIFQNENGERILGLINPISNEIGCASPECHVHPDEMKLLGVLDVQMSLAAMDKSIANNKNNLITTSLVFALLIAAFTGVFIWIMVHTRMKELIKGTKAIGEGNLNYKIPIIGKDELGVFSQNFNLMAESLNKAYSEIKELNENLNEKINEKTEQLKEIYGQINQIEKIASLGKLSATVAHELNNPLEGILTYSKLIKKKLEKMEGVADKEKIISFLEFIASESDRCGNIVKNLLVFARATENIIQTETINPIIERCLLLIAHHLQINNIKLITDIPAEPIQVDCDKDRLQQALLAVLINAVESMTGGGTLYLSIKTTEEKVKFEIKDTGCGISEEHLDKIFEPFFTTKTTGKGTGLGLSVVYGIIQQHNGKISVKSKEGEGTSFIIEIPKVYKNVDN